MTRLIAFLAIFITVTANAQIGLRIKGLKVLESGEINRTIYVISNPFFAKGDGVTDDGPAIQLADDALGTEGVLIFPEGVYESAQKLLIGSNTTWRGLGRGATIRLAAGANVDLIQIATGASNITFENLTFDGDSSNQTSNLLNCVVGASDTNITFRDVTFTNATRSGIRLASGGSKNIRILDCYFFDFGRAALHLIQVGGGVVKGTIFEKWATSTDSPAFQLDENNTNFTIDNNIFLNDAAGKFAIEVTLPSDTLIGLSSSVISNNVFDGNGLGANGVSGFFSFCTMSGNTHVNGGGTHRSGYEILGTDNVIEGNQIENGTIHYSSGLGFGVKPIDAKRVKIANNVLTNSSVNVRGIGIGGTATSPILTDISIEGNIIDLSGSSGSSSAIWLGFVGSTGTIKRISVKDNLLFDDDNVANGIRLLALAGSSDIVITNNEVHGFGFGYLDDAVTNYDEVTITNNDFRNNTTPIDHNATSGTFRFWGNIVSDNDVSFDLGGGSTVTPLKFLEASGNGTNFASFESPASLAANTIYVLPPNDGVVGQQLQTDGSGVLTWEAAGSGTGAFSDAGDPIVQNTTTKDVHIGDGADGLTGKLEIGGDADQPQFVIEGFSTQTDDIFIIQNDANTELFNVSPSPSISLREVADAPADEAAYGQIWVNLATPNELFFTDDLGTDFQLGQSGTGAFSDAGDPIVQNTTTKRVEMGDGAGTLAGKVEIGGDADEPQLVIEGFSTQTDDIFIIQNDADAEQFSVSATGNVTVAGTVDGVDIAARDHDAVTLAGTPDYITISGQIITRTQLDMADDLAAFTSANFSGKVSDEIGTGFIVLQTLPIFLGASIDIGGGASVTELRLLEPSGGGTEYASFKVPALAANTDYTLPPDDGDSGEQLQTDGAGVLTWEASGAGAGAFSDAGDPVVLNTTTKDVVIGGGAILDGAKFSIDGDTDQRQAIIQGFSTQTNPILTVEDDAGTDLFVVDGDGGVVIGGSSTTGALLIVNDGVSRQFFFEKYSADAGADEIVFRKARGSVATPGAVVVNDDLGGWFAEGHDATSFVIAARIQPEVDGTVSTGIVPGRIVFQTANTSGTLAEAMRINEAGKTGFGPTGATDRLLHATESTALTSTVQDVLRLTHETSGTPAVGIGLGIEGEVETTAGNNEIGGIIELVTTDVGAGTEDFDWVFFNMAAGATATETMRLTSAGLLQVAVGLDAIGAVDMDYGSSNVTDHTFIADGTTDADFVVPLTSIGGAEIVSNDIGPTQIDETASYTWTGTHDFSSGLMTLDQGAAPAPTVEGRIEWETDDDHIIVGDGSAQVEFVPAEDVGGDATMDDAGTLTIANNAVTNVKAADMVASSVKMRFTTSTGDPEDAINTSLTTVTATSGDFVIAWDADDSFFLKKINVSDFLGGGVAWDAIGDPTTGADIAFANLPQTMTFNTPATETATDAFTFRWTHDATITELTQRLLVLERQAAGAGDKILETMLRILNSDDVAVTTGIEIIGTSTGAITNAIDASDAEIGTVLLTGANDIITTAAATISQTEMDRLDGLAGIIATDVTAVTDLDGTALTITAGALGVTADGIGPTQIDETAIYTWSGANIISGVHEVQDDIDFNFGNDADWGIQYDEGVDNQLIFETTNTSAIAITDPMFEILVGTTPTADQQVFGVAKGTQASNTPLLTLDEDGDFNIAGNLQEAGADVIVTGADINALTTVTAVSGDFLWGRDATDGLRKKFDAVDFLGGASEWTQAASILHPDVSATEEVAIGGTTEALADIFLGADGAAVFNEQGLGATSDFRVETDTEPDAIFVDASANFVNFGSQTDIGGGVQIDGDADIVQFKVQGHSTQTAAIMVVESSTGPNILQFDQDGTDARMKLGANGFNGVLRFFSEEAVDATIDIVTPADVTSTGDSYVLVLPVDEGTSGFQLTTDGADPAILSWTAAGAGAFSDAGDPVVLNTTTKDVVIGGGAILDGAKFSIDGDVDQRQAVIQAFSTQTNPILTVETSTGTDLFTVANNGNAFVSGNLLLGADVQMGRTGASELTIFDDVIFTCTIDVASTAVLRGNVFLGNSVGDSPQIQFAPNSGTQWNMFTENTGKDLQIESDATASTETVDIVNPGAGVADLDVEGTLLLGTALAVAEGGSGATTLTGLLIGNGASAFTATTTSAGVAGEITDEIGTGFMIFQTNPIFLGASVDVGGGATVTELRLLEASGSGTNYASFDVPALAANTDYLLPPDDGDSGEQLQTDGAGVLTWEAAGSGTGAFSDAADPVVLNTTTKDVQIGAAQFNTAKLSIDNEVDQVAFSIQGHSTQTTSLIIAENSAGADQLTLSNTGVLTLGTDLAVSEGGSGAGTFTDGGILLGSAASPFTAMAVLADGSIVVGDGATDPVALAAFTSSTGDLIHEAGGLEADVSAFTGLLAISGGTTSEVDAKSELETQIADVADFAEADGDVFTGVHDFGGATSLEAPNAAGGTTVDVAGEFTVDTTPGSFNFHDGSSEKVLSSEYTKSFVITDPTATDDFPVWRVPFAITITAIHLLVEGGTNLIGGLDEGDANGNSPVAVDSDITGTAGTNANDDGSLTNPTIDANDYLLWHTTSISGSPTSVTVSWEYTIDP